MKRLITFLTLICLFVSQGVAAATHSLLTGLQSEHVDVTMTFTGSNTLIYGALSKPGDVVIKVSSPEVSVDLTHKKAIGPFWLDSGKVTVRKTPGLYYLMSSRPLKNILSPEQREKFGLHLQDALKQAKVNSAAASTMGNWQKAFLDLKRNAGLYRQLPHAVKLVEKRLFSATIELPATIPLGTYHLDIYMVQHGQIISHQTRNLNVNQVRLEHWVADAVNNHSWLFGIAFTIFALLLGLTLGMALRRGSDS